jgi:hypothetical protein
MTETKLYPSPESIKDLMGGQPLFIKMQTMKKLPLSK